MKTGSRVILVLMILAVVAIAAVPLLFDLPDNTHIWNEIQNTGHTPLFGVIALLLLGISTRLLGERIRNRRTHYAIAFIGACLLGAITEFAQIIGPRDADLGDLLRDVAGAISFLGLFMFFDSGFKKSRHQISDQFRKKVLILSILVTLGSLVPLTLSSTAYLQRNSAFPLLCDFDSYWGKRFLITESARLKIVPPPEGMNAARGKVGQLALRAGEYPGFGILEPYSDWGAYKTLEFNIYSPLDSTVNIHIRVEDFHHDGDFTDRFNRTLSIVPGENHISISLLDIQVAPRGREMDMSAIAAIHFFAVDLRQRLTLYFDNVHLQ